MRNTIAMHWLVGAGDAFKQASLFATVVLIVAAALKDKEVGDVAAESEAGSDQHELSIDLGRI